MAGAALQVQLVWSSPLPDVFNGLMVISNALALWTLSGTGRGGKLQRIRRHSSAKKEKCRPRGKRKMKKTCTREQKRIF